MSFKVVGFRFLVAVTVFILTAASARSDFVITGADENVAAGSTAEVTFSISDTNQDQLAAFLLQLQITGSPGNSGYLLQFSDLSLQPDPYNSSTYVFSGNSSDQGPPSYPFWDSVGSSSAGSTINDLALGSDSVSNNPVTLSANTSYVLATVQIDATGALVGDTYQIGLAPANTFFEDANGDTLGYSSSVAYITIVAPAVSAVPAPSSLLLAGIGSLTILLYHRWRTRREVSSRCCGNV